MKKTLIQRSIFILNFILIISCKTVNVLPTRTPIKNVELEALAQKIKANYPKINKLRSRIKAVYDDGKREQQIIVQLRMETKKIIWLSATMLIPIAKLKVTPNEISFYEKFQKTYFQGNFNLINSSFGTKFGFSDLENLFLGKPFSDPAQGQWKQIMNPQYYILAPKGKRSIFTPTLFFDPASFLLKEQRFLIPGTTNSLTIKYLRHIKIEGKSLPTLIDITLFDGNNSKKLVLDFSRTDFTEGLTFPFEIPQGYSKIKF